MTAKLLIFRGDEIDRVALTKRDLRIGRAPENDIVLEDHDKTVSRYHAELRHEQGNYVLIDVNSQNGIWVDGQRVQRAKLEPGRPVVLGKVRIELEQAVSEPPPPPTVLARPAASAEAETLGPPQGVSEAAPVTPRPPPSTRGGRSTVVEGKGAPGTPMTEPSLVSKIANPRFMAIGLGILVLAVVVLAVVLRIILTPSVPSSDRAGTDVQPRQASEEPDLPVLDARKIAVAELLTNMERTGIGKVGARSGALGIVGIPPGGARVAAEAARQQQISRAKLALARGDYRDAIERLERLPASSGAGPLLEQARELRGQRAEGLMREGARLEEGGSLETAYRRYAAARAVDASAPGIDAALTRIEGKMKTAGAEAYTRARQYDALGHTEEAVPLYETAVELLPLSDPNRRTARSRLAELRKGAR